jgi:hypothetical protein
MGYSHHLSDDYRPPLLKTEAGDYGIEEEVGVGRLGRGKAPVTTWAGKIKVSKIKQ